MGLSLALLAVGIVSGTLVRHVIQIVPAAMVLGFVVRRTPGATFGAYPVLAIWLFIMVAIWLYLAGLARIVTGHYSPTEIVLTLVIGASCLAGMSQVFRAQPAVSLAARAAWTVAFAALQVGAIWLSLRPAVADI